MNVVSNKTNVTVNGQVFAIPSVKTQELLNMLAQWQSIAVTEQAPSQNPNWNGQQLING
jgi:hypothetical protein|tara:strand:+ start:21744 stop:21920 length:177 start_codon:yes stop_codon:yes gene_type:complete